MSFQSHGIDSVLGLMDSFLLQGPWCYGWNDWNSKKYANKIMINDNYLQMDDVILLIILLSNIWMYFFYL